VAPKEAPREPRPAAHRVSSGRPTRKKWPSYKFCLDNAPLAHGENKPDTSRADFTWCRTAIEWGWSVEATASRLLELSEKAKENGERYATLTATGAAESVERQPLPIKTHPPAILAIRSLGHCYSCPSLRTLYNPFSERDALLGYRLLQKERPLNATQLE